MTRCLGCLVIGVVAAVVVIFLATRILYGFCIFTPRCIGTKSAVFVERQARSFPLTPMTRITPDSELPL